MTLLARQEDVCHRIDGLEQSLRHQISVIDQGVENNRTALVEIRQRLIHTEDKLTAFIEGGAKSKFGGHADQRYGHISYSQHGEDMVLIALFDRIGVAHPSFLDIGANHPLNCSNTALLRERCGSRGVNVDANPDAIEIFKRERPEDVNVNVGVAGQQGSMIFYRFDHYSPINTFSKAHAESFMASNVALRIQDEIVVPVLTLDQVVDTYCDGLFPDLLSIDAEGLDYEILMAGSFATRPKILCVETVGPSGDMGNSIDELVASKGFRKCIRMHGNTIYLDSGLSL